MNLEKLTKDRFKALWEKEQKYLKYNFGLRLNQYAYGKNYDYTTSILPNSYSERTQIIESYRKRSTRGSSRDKQFNRLLIGYYGTPVNLTPKKCGLRSEASIGKSQKETTNDHIIGVTSASQFVLEEFKGRINREWKNVDLIDKVIFEMSNNWLENHLWLWAQCRITKKEHSPSRLKRGNRYTIEQKKNFEHYIEAGIKLTDY